MRNAKRTILIMLLIGEGFAPLGSRVTARQTPAEKRSNAWDLLRKSRSKQTESAEIPAKERVVHFPADRSVGQLFEQEATRVRQITDFFHWGDPTEWEYLCEAKGDVSIPSGKRLSLTVSQTASNDMSWLSVLGPDDLYRLAFTPSSGSSDNRFRLSDKNMENISRLTGLKYLDLRWTVIGDKGIENIRHLTALEYLDTPPRLTDGGLALIAEIPSLKGLYFLGRLTSGITNASLRHLSKLTSLEELYISGDHIGDAGLAHLRELPRLQYLLLCSNNFTDAGLIHVKEITSLRILSLPEGLCQITDAGLISISNMPSLENLYLDVKGPITDNGLAHLSKMRSLKKLHLSRSQVTDRGLAYLAQIKTLEHLDLPQEQKGITDKGITCLGELPNLRQLAISRIHYIDPKMNKDYYTDKGLEALVKCRNLEELSIGSIGVTDAGMDHIAKLANLKWLNLFGCENVTDAGLVKLTALTSLRNLHITSADVSFAGLKNLKPMSNLTNLTVLNVKRGGTVMDISGLANLEDLMLNFTRKSGDKFTDADLMCLRNLKRLKSLQINPHDFNDKGMGYLAGLTNMERLIIGGPGLTDEGLKFLSNMKKINQLTISDGNFTDMGLRHIEGLQLLHHLSITSANAFSNTALERLRNNLPDLWYCRIVP